MQSGYLNELIVFGAFNSDFVEERLISKRVITLSIVSESGFVVAQDIIPEADLPSLTRASIQVASIMRQSLQLGEKHVSYDLDF